MVGVLSLREALTSLGIRCPFRAGKTAFLARGRVCSLLGEECLPCSSGSSNIARDVRVALSKGLRSLYLRVSLRARGDPSPARCEGLAPLGTMVAFRSG